MTPERLAHYRDYAENESVRSRNDREPLVGSDIRVLAMHVRELCDEIERLRALLRAEGYRQCDIPACNCGSWHGGHAMARLTEIRDVLDEYAPTNGPTILARVTSLAMCRGGG